MIYVFSQAQLNDDAALEITLQMAMEPELRLRFSSYTQYCDWKSGLEVIRQLLEQPSNPFQDEPPINGPTLFAGAKDVPHSLLRTLLLEGPLPGAFGRHNFRLTDLLLARLKDMKGSNSSKDISEASGSAQIIIQRRVDGLIAHPSKSNLRPSSIIPVPPV